MPAISTKVDPGTPGDADEMSQRPRDASGWSLFALIGAVILLMSNGIVLIVPGVTQATETLIRATASTSFVLLLAALLAPSLATWLPSGFTHALMRERRSLFLSFALSLLVNLAAIAALTAVKPDLAGLSGLALIEGISTLGALFAGALFLLCAVLVRPAGNRVHAGQHSRARMPAHQRIPPRS